jgi:hypothetical protein
VRRFISFAGICLLAGAFVTTMLTAPSVRADANEQCASSYENAQLFRLRGRYVEARDALLVCLSNECPKLLRSDCLTWLPQVEASLPSVVFAISDVHGKDVEAARVYANGKLLEGHGDGRAHAIDPGVYKLRFEAPGHKPEEQTLTVREAEKNRMVRVRLALDANGTHAAGAAAEPGIVANELPPGETHRLDIPVLTYALGGASVASLGLFTYFAVAGKREHDRLEKACAPECEKSRTKEGRRKYILADVSLGVSMACAGAAVWSYFWQRKDRANEPPPLALSVSPDSVAVGWGRSF